MKKQKTTPAQKERSDSPARADRQSPETKRTIPSDSQYETRNDGQAGLTGEAVDKQYRPKRLRYDGASLSDGSTWGSVATLLRSPHHGFGL